LHTELQASLGSLRKYQQSYYPVWEPSYEPYVTAQYEALQYPGFEQASRVSALTYQMIYEQPVLYEFRNLDVPTLLVIGQEDRTVVGKNLLSKQVALAHGNYPALGRWLQQQVKGSKLVPLAGVGHIPHIQVPDNFLRAVIPFLAANE
jgi:pimeloyl-ACP methyl ester carboxylesterase